MKRDTVKIQCLEYIRQKVEVSIYYNTETGEGLWSISPTENPGWWIESFKSKSQAKKFCAKHGLPIREEGL